MRREKEHEEVEALNVVKVIRYNRNLLGKWHALRNLLN